MTTRRQLLQAGGIASFAALVGGSLSACGFSSPGNTNNNNGGTKSITIQGPTLPTLDPQVISNGMWMVNRGLLEGLVIQNDEGTDVAPGAAERWEASTDGLTYTFHLREAKWSDGSPVTAKDFEFAYKRLLSPSSAGAGVTLGANSYVTSMNIKNAIQFQGGIVTDWSQVGVKAPDDKTIVIELAAPNIGFLMGMTHASMLPLPQKVVEAKGAEWEKPENLIVNGPFKMTAMQVNSSMTLVKNDQYWDAANVKLDQVNYRMSDSVDENIVPFENGEVDIMGVGSPATLMRFDKEPNLQGQLKSAKPGSIYYLALLHSENTTLDDIRIRQALSLAMERDTVAKSVPKITATTSLVPQSVKDWDASVGVAEDIEKAKQLLSDAGFPGGKGLPPITILNGGAASPVVQTIMSNWKKNLGIEVKNDVTESGVYVKKRAALNAPDYLGFYFGSFAAELNWSKWVASLWSPTFTKPFSLKAADYKAYLALQQDKNLKPAELTAKLKEIADTKCSAEVKNFADLTEKAMGTVNADEAVKAFKEASLAREKCFIFIPIAQAGYHFAVNKRVTGFHPRPTGDQFYYKTLGVQ